MESTSKDKDRCSIREQSLLDTPRARLGARVSRTLCPPVLYSRVPHLEVQRTAIGKLFQNKSICIDKESSCHSLPKHCVSNITSAYIMSTMHLGTKIQARAGEGKACTGYWWTTPYVQKSLDSLRILACMGFLEPIFQKSSRLAVLGCLFIYYSCSYCNSLGRCGFGKFCKHVRSQRAPRFIITGI